MTQSMKDKIKGTLHEAKGTVKEKVGQVTNNPNLTAKGKIEKLAGSAGSYCRLTSTIMNVSGFALGRPEVTGTNSAVGR